MASKSDLMASLAPQRSWKAHYLSILSLVAILVLFIMAGIYHYLIYLPQPKQPHLFAILEYVFALEICLLVGLGGWTLGRRLLKWFPLQRLTRLEQSSLALGLGWGAFSLGVLGLGMAHLLYTWIILAGLALVILPAWQDVRHLIMSFTNQRWYAPLTAIRPGSPYEYGLALILVFQLVLASTQVFAFPVYPRGWDTYSYHWAIPQLFLFDHAVSAVPGWASADFPINSEMLNLLALAFNSPAAALMLLVVFGVLTALLIAGFLYRHHGSSAAWLGALLCMASPLFAGYLMSGYVEPATAYYGVASLVIILVWFEQQRLGEAPFDWRLPLLAGLFIGVGVGVKYQEGMTVAGIILLFGGAAAIWLLTAWRLRAKRAKKLVRLLLGTILYVGGVLLPLLPWLLKDWIALGNPIYPFVWGGPGWNATRAQVGTEQIVHFGPVGSLGTRMITAFFQFFVDNGRADDLPFLPLNYLLVLAPLLAPMDLLRSWRQWSGWNASERNKVVQGIAWLVVVVGGYSVWVITQTTHNRYALSWVMLLVVPTAILLTRLLRAFASRPVLRKSLQSVIILLLLVGPLYSLSFWSSVQPFSLLAGQISLRQWEQDHLGASGYWDMVDYINSQLPHQAKVLLIGTGWGYFLQGHDYIDDTDGDWVPYLMTEGKTPSGVVELLRQQGISYLSFHKQGLQFNVKAYGTYTIQQYLPAFQHVLSSALILVGTFGEFFLYRLPET